MTRENAIAESGREPFDLRFDFVGDVDLRTERDMRVGPQRMFPARRPRFVEQALLRDKNERSLGKFSMRDVPLSVRNLIERSAKVDRASAAARVRFPRNR